MRISACTQAASELWVGDGVGRADGKGTDQGGLHGAGATGGGGEGTWGKRDVDWGGGDGGAGGRVGGGEWGMGRGRHEVGMAVGNQGKSQTMRRNHDRQTKPV